MDVEKEVASEGLEKKVSDLLSGNRGMLRQECTFGAKPCLVHWLLTILDAQHYGSGHTHLFCKLLREISSTFE